VQADTTARMTRNEARDGAVSKLLLGVALLLPLGLSGCFLHKKVAAVVLPVSTAPMVLASAPESENPPPLIETPPEEEIPVPIAEAAATPRPRRRPTPRPVNPAATAPASTPTQVASAEGLGDESAIGALTAGGDASPQTRQEATELIASNDKRLKALPASTVKAQHSQINKILNFQRQALAALNSGDAEGAKTLATKAKLLLFDLDRGGGE
jgi:hypothetical protein